jgi:hypothetical protein
MMLKFCLLPNESLTKESSKHEDHSNESTLTYGLDMLSEERCKEISYTDEKGEENKFVLHACKN